ncbi:TraR/DksA C4-type zinc finger protein [Tepidibacter hydrothermalis]|uniref:TraR/DksA C4-type zinc finger protein n=1 Tax=Tepidibacter hydrothermalis TaxID=3036126 RepID=A0ABY8EC84_9FIRM|nr:TraR/DksA C4-type zinc finger protein [Tepidibacter hydrothermalis]WFD09117.1 TraR/DksA C4-type zinc finger protein [Tepidibacter hydrothermalis]
MNKSDMEYYRQILLKEKDKVANLIEEIEDDTVSEDDFKNSSIKESTGELSGYDNHPADMGTEVFMRAMDLKLKNGEAMRLYNINKALEKVDLGLYGKCEECNADIDSERLDIIPETLLCSNCSKQHKKEFETVEEDIFSKSEYFYSELVEGLESTNRYEGLDLDYDEL